jgi:hypothetical protein
VKLADYVTPVSYDIAFWMTAFENPDYPLDQLGNVSIDVQAKLRAAAIMVLLTKGDSDAFFHNLMRSARCRMAYLQRLQDAAVSNAHHQASGRVDGILDAVAASDFPTARAIVALSPTAWRQGAEYEDDFCYAQVLHGLLAPQVDRNRLDGLFARAETVIAGQADARLSVAKAIYDRSQPAFDESFEALLAGRTAQIEADKLRNKIEEPIMMANRQVYVEALALLNIAVRLGLVAQQEYLYCPSIARLPMQKPFPSA